MIINKYICLFKRLNKNKKWETIGQLLRVVAPSTNSKNTFLKNHGKIEFQVKFCSFNSHAMLEGDFESDEMHDYCIVIPSRKETFYLKFPGYITKLPTSIATPKRKLLSRLPFWIIMQVAGQSTSRTIKIKRAKNDKNN